MSPEDVVKAIYKMDVDGLMTSDFAVRAAGFAPVNDEERAIVSEREDKVELLQPVEAYMIVLSRIPNLRERMDAVVERAEFGDSATRLADIVEVFQAAVDALASSQNLPEFFKWTLAVGNFINGQTKLGRASGVNVGVLNKLHMLKSVDNSITLLDYIVSILTKHSPQTLGLLIELKGVC